MRRSYSTPSYRSSPKVYIPATATKLRSSNYSRRVVPQIISQHSSPYRRMAPLVKTRPRIFAAQSNGFQKAQILGQKPRFFMGPRVVLPASINRYVGGSPVRSSPYQVRANNSLRKSVVMTSNFENPIFENQGIQRVKRPDFESPARKIMFGANSEQVSATKPSHSMRNSFQKINTIRKFENPDNSPNKPMRQQVMRNSAHMSENSQTAKLSINNHVQSQPKVVTIFRKENFVFEPKRNLK